MSEIEDGYIGVGTYLIVVAVFAALGLSFWFFDYRRKKKFIDVATQDNEMTRQQAETLYKIRGNRLLLHPSDKKFRRLDVFQTRNFHAENFYQLHRWIKCLREAKRSGQLDDYTEQLVRQMEERMHIFQLRSFDQKRLWELSMLPERVLTKYDYEQTGLTSA